MSTEFNRCFCLCGIIMVLCAHDVYTLNYHDTCEINNCGALILGLATLASTCIGSQFCRPGCSLFNYRNLIKCFFVQTDDDQASDVM